MRRPWITLILMLASGPALAKVGAARLSDVLRGTDVAVLAKVKSIEQIRGKKIAVADVEEVLYGAERPATVAFVAEASWTCDISTANPNERAVLLLARAGNAIEKELLDAVRKKYGVELHEIADARSDRLRDGVRRHLG